MRPLPTVLVFGTSFAPHTETPLTPCVPHGSGGSVTRLSAKLSKKFIDDCLNNRSLDDGWFRRARGTAAVNFPGRDRAAPHRAALDARMRESASRGCRAVPDRRKARARDKAMEVHEHEVEFDCDRGVCPLPDDSRLLATGALSSARGRTRPGPHDAWELLVPPLPHPLRRPVPPLRGPQTRTRTRRTRINGLLAANEATPRARVTSRVRHKRVTLP